ncbi:MAG TPA: hypothetical protein PLC48_11845 [Ferruginibacter sp.]|nr:hypothetical protein [Ferruginibacter sp.]
MLINKNLMLLTSFAAVAGYWFARMKPSGKLVPDSLPQTNKPGESSFMVSSFKEIESRPKKDWENAGTFKPNL